LPDAFGPRDLSFRPPIGGISGMISAAGLATEQGALHFGSAERAKQLDLLLRSTTRRLSSCEAPRRFDDRLHDAGGPSDSALSLAEAAVDLDLVERGKRGR